MVGHISALISNFVLIEGHLISQSIVWAKDQQKADFFNSTFITVFKRCIISTNHHILCPALVVLLSLRQFTFIQAESAFLGITKIVKMLKINCSHTCGEFFRSQPVKERYGEER